MVGKRLMLLFIVCISKQYESKLLQRVRLKCIMNSPGTGKGVLAHCSLILVSKRIINYLASMVSCAALLNGGMCYNTLHLGVHFRCYDYGQ